jgi:hypothetical protein
MANQPRKHHYVPKFHLAGFTQSGEVDDKLYVADKRQRRKWVSTPSNTARETDFYKIEGDGVDPMEIEKAFAKMEGQCAAVLKEIVERPRIPTGEGFGVLMNFVAYAAARVPIKRATISASIDEATKAIMRREFLGPEGAKLLRKLGEDGTDEDMAKLQEFIAGNDYTINVEQNWHVGMITQAVDALLPAMAYRNWALWVAGDDVPDLVCSDSPVAFCATEPRPPLMPMGFGTPKTMLTFPLTRRMALTSTFEELPSDSYVMHADDVALINSLTALNANQIYSAEEDWLWAGESVTCGAQAYLDSLTDAPAADE